MEQTKVKNLNNRQAFSADELPQVIPFGRRTIDRMISAGEFPAHDKKIRKRKIWTLDTIRHWLNAQ
jgi:predicted DNA-binding transcriptional regulator AlpA